MPTELYNRPYSFNSDPATAIGEFSRIDKLVEDAVNEAGEKNAAVLIAKYSNHLLNAANKVVDDVNRHPYFLQLLELQFDDGVASVTADDTMITMVSGFSGVGPYTPMKLRGVGYGSPTPGDVFTFTLGSWVNGQTSLRIADAPHATKADCVVSPLYRGRISRYISPSTEARAIGDRVMIEGIKYYWAVDRDVTTRPQNVQKQRMLYYTELNSWLGQLRNVHGILEIDHDQRGHDY